MNMPEDEMSRSVDLIVRLDHFDRFDAMGQGRRMVLLVVIAIVAEGVYVDSVPVVHDELIGVLDDGIFLVLRIENLFGEFRISVAVMVVVAVAVVDRWVLTYENRNDSVHGHVSNELNL